MLRHAFEPLEGSNVLWHIVGPPPLPFSLSFLECFTRFSFACLFGWKFDYTRRSYKFFEKGVCLRKFHLCKNCGTTLERGRNQTWGRQNLFFCQKVNSGGYYLFSVQLALYSIPLNYMSWLGIDNLKQSCIQLLNCVIGGFPSRAGDQIVTSTQNH